MFRNFVSPASLERENIRESLPPEMTSAHAQTGQAVQNHPSQLNKTGDVIQNGSNHVTSVDGFRTGVSSSGTTIVQSSDSTGKGGGYKTSIFVNGGAGGGPNSGIRQEQGTPKPHHPSHSQSSHNMPTSSRRQGRPATSGGQNGTSSECPQSPHPATHSTHSYTPLHSADLGLASVSITEADYDDEHQSPSREGETSTFSYHNNAYNTTNSNIHGQFHGTGSSIFGRPEEHHVSHGLTQPDPSLYPIQDEQEEEDDFNAVGGPVGNGYYNDAAFYQNSGNSNPTSHSTTSPPQQMHQNGHNALHVLHHHHQEQQPVPSQLYSQKTYNVVPPPPPTLEQVFAGRRDVRDPKSASEKQIVSAKGTVRGFKNRVKAGIATFWAQPEDQILEYKQTQQTKIVRNFRSLEQGKIIVYATTMCVVRETSERCKTVRNLLQNHMVRYEERDLYMSREIQQELKYRLAQEGIEVLKLPHVFADGIYLGGADELVRTNEIGELRALLNNYQKIVVRINCEKCGGYRFIPCDTCHGSKRSLLRNHFTEEFCALRCMHCDESGLRRCDMCIDQQE